MTKAFEQKILANGFVNTRKYCYQEMTWRHGPYGIYLCEQWKFDTTAMLENDAWELVKEL